MDFYGFTRKIMPPRSICRCRPRLLCSKPPGFRTVVCPLAVVRPSCPWSRPVDTPPFTRSSCASAVPDGRSEPNLGASSLGALHWGGFPELWPTPYRSGHGGAVGERGQCSSVTKKGPGACFPGWFKVEIHSVSTDYLPLSVFVCS